MKNIRKFDNFLNEASSDKIKNFKSNFEKLIDASEIQETEFDEKEIEYVYSDIFDELGLTLDELKKILYEEPGLTLNDLKQIFEEEKNGRYGWEYKDYIGALIANIEEEEGISYTNRKSGFYKVKKENEWMVAKFDKRDKIWYITGSESIFRDEDFQVIDNKPVRLGIKVF